MKAELSEGFMEILPLSDIQKEKGFRNENREWICMLKEQLHYPRVEMLPEGVIGELVLPEEKESAKAASFHDFEEHTGEHRAIPICFFLQKDRIRIVTEEKNCLLLGNRLSGHIVEEGMMPVRFLIRMLDSIIKEDMRLLQNLEAVCYRLEETLQSGEEKENPSVLMTASRKSLRIRSFLYQQLLEVSDTLAENPCDFFTESEVRSIQRFGSKVDRLSSYAQVIREYMVQLREMYQQRLDEQQNRTMQFLTVVTTIFLPLTLITGWYGMNFVYMPELRSPYGYVAIVIICLSIVIGEIIFFKKKKYF